VGDAGDVHQKLCLANGLEADCRRAAEVLRKLADGGSGADREAAQSTFADLRARFRAALEQWRDCVVAFQTRKRLEAEAECVKLSPSLQATYTAYESAPSFEGREKHLKISEKYDGWSSIVSAAHAAIIHANDRVKSAERGA
jgi:hypothetical protein